VDRLWRINEERLWTPNTYAASGELLSSNATNAPLNSERHCSCHKGQGRRQEFERGSLSSKSRIFTANFKDFFPKGVSFAYPDPEGTLTID
jgi:hypothetical protein